MPTNLLLRSISRCSYKTAKAHIDAGADVNAQGKDGNYVIHRAMNNKDTAILKLLIAAGADVNTISGTYNSHLPVCNWMRTPLVFAVYWNQVDRVELLIAAGADVNLDVESGNDPINYVFRRIDWENNLFTSSGSLDNRSRETLFLLKKHGAVVTKKTVDKYQDIMEKHFPEIIAEYQATILRQGLENMPLSSKPRGKTL